MKRSVSTRQISFGVLVVPFLLGLLGRGVALADGNPSDGPQIDPMLVDPIPVDPTVESTTTIAATATAPAVPGHVTAHWTGIDELGYPEGVLLTWDAVPGAIGYNIYRGLHVVPRPAGATTLLHRGVLVTNFSDPEADMGVDSVPVYQVTAVNATGESARSAKVEPTRAAPAVPAHLTARWAGTDAHGRLHGVTLTWDAVPGAASYNVYRGLKVAPRPAGPTTLLRRRVTGTTFTDADASLGVDTIPVYQVTAVNGMGESAKSRIAVPLASGVMLSDTQPNLVTHSLRLTFTGALQATTASVAANYRVQVNSRTVPVQSAGYNERTHSVTLVLPAGSLQRGVVTVTWSGLRDVADNPVPGQVAIQID